jgi:RNA-splicing ligase RtcB
MQHIKGKHTYIRVMIDEIDDLTREQIQAFADHPVFSGSKVRIMPDCHAGAGAVIGTTATMGDAIIPNMVGVDIGCGMLSVNIGRMDDIDFQALDEHIRREVPMGFNHHQDHERIGRFGHSKTGFTLVEKFDWLLGNPQFQSLSKLRGGIVLKESFPLSFGTLGGGNHFIELGRDEKEDVWVTIHSGSRGFGHAIATWHQKKAKILMESVFLGDKYSRMEFLPAGFGMEDYLHDMKIAQDYAQLNRRIMMHKILHFWVQTGKTWDKLNAVESVHNYIDFDDGIIRKGAIAANEGQKVVIPFNMEDGLIIGEGLGNHDWNCSAPHGAGRIGSRTWAKANLSLSDAKESMADKGIWTSSLNKNTLDEVKGAYKDKDAILAARS